MVLPVVAIVGRPNVGKSTLFNYLTKSRDALVCDVPGVTRDRQYGQGRVGDRPFLVVDTGGIEEPENEIIAQLTEQQVVQALDEADIIFFMVDAKSGRVTADEAVAKRLRHLNKTVYLLVNKADRELGAIACSDFYSIGLGEPYPISATSGRGIKEMLSLALDQCLVANALNADEEQDNTEENEGIKIAVLGRPNVGKSTLINRMLGDDRLVVCDMPGTTRDSIYVPFSHQGTQYTLIDTAGLRKRRRVTDVVEKFSWIKTMQAMQAAHVILLVLNAKEGITEQDMRLLGLILDSGKALVLVFNKWDGLDEDDKDQFHQAIERKLPFVDYARRYQISALHGTGIGHCYRAIRECYASGQKKLSTAQVTQALEQAILTHQPPLVKGRRIKLRFAHVGSHSPLQIVIHGKQVDALPNSYKRFLSNYFRKTFKLEGVPVLLKFKQADNPYKQ